MTKAIILNLATDFVIKVASAADSKNKNLSIQGYASVFDITDSQKDVVSKGAFSSAINHEKIRFLWQHDRTKPIGCLRSAKTDHYGLKINAEINSQCLAGREAIALIKQGAVKGLSVGFNILRFFYDDFGKRVIEKAELVEISIVTFPANSHAIIESFKTGKAEAVYGNTNADRLGYITKKIVDLQSKITEIKQQGGI